MSQAPQPNSDRARVDFVMSVVNVVGLGGVVMLGSVLLALFIGLTLDKFLGTRPLFTIGLLVLSAPVSIFMMFRIALSAIAKIKPLTQSKSETPGDSHP